MAGSIPLPDHFTTELSHDPPVYENPYRVRGRRHRRGLALRATRRRCGLPDGHPHFPAPAPATTRYATLAQTAQRHGMVPSAELDVTVTYAGKITTVMKLVMGNVTVWELRP
jgi:hypothetical protein